MHRLIVVDNRQQRIAVALRCDSSSLRQVDCRNAVDAVCEDD